MPARHRPSNRRRDRPAVQVIGGPGRFDWFFDREARGALAVALLVAYDPASAEDAVRRAFARALREWPRLGVAPDPGMQVRRWAVGHARPSRRQRRAVTGDDAPARIRAALWSMPRHRARLATVGLAQGKGLEAVDGLLSAVTEGPSPVQRGLWDLADRVGGPATLGSLVEAALEAIGEQVAEADVEALRPSVGGSPRWRRSVVAVAALAAVVVAALATLTVDQPPPPDPEATPTTRPSAITRSGPIVLEEAPWWVHQGRERDTFRHYLPGWEPISDLDAAWIQSAIGLGDRLFVWAVTEQPEPPDFSSSGSGFVYDPAADEWSGVAPLPDAMCAVHGPISMIDVDGQVLVLFWTDPFDDACARAAVYSPSDDRWAVLAGDFFAAPGAHPMVWTGEWMVAPAAGLAHRWETGETVEIPIVVGVAGSVDAHWTGSVVLAVGHFGVRSWAPGDDEWTVVDETGVYSTADRGTAWTNAGLLMAIRSSFWFLGDGGLRDTGLGVFDRCWGSVVRSTTPITQHCGGYAVWDEARESWVPIPPHALWSWGFLVEAGDHLYAFGAGAARTSLARAADGSIVLPATIPVGSAFLDLPGGFSLVETIRSSWLSGRLEGLDGWAVRLDGDDGAVCTVAAVFPDLGGPYQPEGMEAVGDRSIDRPGSDPLDGVAFADGSGAVAIVIDGNLRPEVMVETLVVTCERAVPEGVDAAAMTLAAGLWSAWEGSFYLSSPFTREFAVEDAEGNRWGFSAPATDPHQESSERATTAFRDCVEGQMSPDFRLIGLYMLVDADGELLSLAYQAVRSGSPPVVEVPEAVRLGCLDAAGVSTAHLESVGALSRQG